jgi:hypothetical protein
MHDTVVAGSRTEVGRVGFAFAVATAALAVFTLGIAVMTPPLSGPYCAAAECFGYPFDGIAARFPRDYYWMVPALVLTLSYVGLIACVQEWAPAGKRIWGVLALAAAILSAATLLGDYFVQLAVIQPSVLAGETDGIAVLSQYNAHGVFIALEELGYLLMALSLACSAPVFEGRGRVERALRLVLGGALAAALAALVFVSLRHGLAREYRFEVAVITIDWLALIVAGILIAVVFRRSRAAAS